MQIGSLYIHASYRATNMPLIEHNMSEYLFLITQLQRVLVIQIPAKEEVLALQIVHLFHVLVLTVIRVAHVNMLLVIHVSIYYYFICNYIHRQFNFQ